MSSTRNRPGAGQGIRNRIMARLHASGTEQTPVPQAAPPPALDLDPDARVERLVDMMTAMRTEVHRVAGDGWLGKLMELARERGWKRCLYGPQGPLGSALEEVWSSEDKSLPELVAYRQPVENFKSDLFESVDVGITSTRGGVADSGAIVLWPTPAEPRLMSLVPAVHVAVLDADQIASTLTEMMAAQNWAAGMPTNALLISGPSKTADIEFQLVFGVHGPKELIVLIRE